MKTTASRSRIPAQSRKSTSTRNGHGNGEPSSRRANLKISPRVAAWLKRPKHNLIDGEWVPAASGQLFDVFNPADGSVIARVPDSDTEDIRRAVAAARRAFENRPVAAPDTERTRQNHLAHR